MTTLRVIQANLGHAKTAKETRERLSSLLPNHGRWVILACEAHQLFGESWHPGGQLFQEPFTGRNWRDKSRGRSEVALVLGPAFTSTSSSLIKLMDGPTPVTKYQHDRWVWRVRATDSTDEFTFLSSHFQANIQRGGIVRTESSIAKDYAAGVAKFEALIKAEHERGRAVVFGADLNYRPTPQDFDGNPYDALKAAGLTVRRHRIDVIATTTAPRATWAGGMENVAGSRGTDHDWLAGDITTHKGEQPVPDNPSKMPDPLERITFRGKTMDRKTAAALAVAERRLGYELTVTQGAYNPGGVGASAGTHDRGGVIDLAPFDAARKVRVLRDLGFAAWRRLPSQGPWPEHVHAVMIGHQDLAPAAADQVTSYLNGRNGLKGDAVDPEPYRPNPAPENFNYAAAWRDDLLRARITGINARIKALRDKASEVRARITYKGGKK